MADTAPPLILNHPTVVALSPLDAAASMSAGLRWVERQSPGMSAQRRLSRRQVLIFALVALLGGAAAIRWPLPTCQVIAALATFIYVTTLAHRVVIFRSSLRENHLIEVTDDQAWAIDDEHLPSYTILVPAFREPEVLGGLVRSLEELCYPRDRLEVKLLLEEGDDETLAVARSLDTALDVGVLIAPAGHPQTKPRALNFGLLWSTGELVTVFDAEDRPEPLQLRRAATALSQLSPEVACLQAQLSFYDADRNMLSRWFAIEYLTWFRCYLPGLVRQGGVMPLGGTSNHFRRSALVEVGAWDPYNVTEDADLGIRLQRKGYRIGVLDSVTLEEVNSDTINWIKQRSRWQKGYLQTALVHLRQPRRLLSELGWRGALQLVLFVGGTPMLALSNTLFWLLSLLWLATRSQMIEQVFPGMVFYLATGTWLIGNFVICYLGVVTVMVTRRSELLLAALMAPFYWILMSVAAIRAVIQMVVDPFHWEKTTHGLSQINS